MANWCFYHNDLDGLVSAAIVNRALKGDVTCIEVTYGMDTFKMIEEEPKEGDHVYFVDFAPSAEVFDKFKEAGYEITIIDHHTRPELEGKEFMGKIEVGEDAACAMCWKHFFPEKDVPRVVQHASKYDVWDHEDAMTLYFYYGLTLIEQDPALEEMWTELFEDSREGEKKNYNAVDQLLGMGQIALFYRTVADERLSRQMFTVEIDGKKFVALNSNVPDSYSFKQWLAKNSEENVDGVLWYYFTGTGWKYSVRSEKEDCDVQEIAAKRGGGGRHNTAGFYAEELIDEIKELGKASE